MTYLDAIQFLYSLRIFGAKLGLDNPRKLAALAGHPQDQLRFIHVAGTNGKGSTCAMLEGIYRAAGLKTGLFTSPHLVSFTERIQVSRQPISEPDVARLVAGMQAWLKSFPADNHPTFFEVITVMALKYFAEQKCDLVIWETGMGGRLDATNIVTPLAGVITNIQFDHTHWLGETLPKIAAEKAGIIKPEVPLITAADEPEALAVIRKTAQQNHAPLTVTDVHTRLPAGVTLSLSGEHQRLNAALAIATVRAIADKIPVPDDAIRQGLAGLHWPGRMQWHTTATGQTFLLDGAHNAAGAASLRQALHECRGRGELTLVLGMLADKNCRAFCEILAPLATRILLVPVASERSAAPDELRAFCAQANPSAKALAFTSLADALAGDADPFNVITGSLYLVGEAMELLGLSPHKPGERALNEWSQK